MKEQLAEQINRTNEDLRVESYERNGALILFCHGAFSLVSHRQQDEAFARVRNAQQPYIVLDLREVGYIDSTGVGTLAMSLKHCMTSGKKLVLVGNDAVRQALRTATLDTIFVQYESLDAALAAIASGT
ncbi:MAG: STAS domain-containing protein [Candidatus Acidiferrales bacterium]